MASQLKNLDNIIMQCPITHKTIAANGKITRVQPPQVIVCYPPSYAPAQVVQSMAAFGPVLSHQPMPVAGQLLVMFTSPASAQWSYGAQLPGRVSATSGDPTADSGFDLAYRLRTIRKVYPQLFAAPCALSLHALAAHDIQGAQTLLPQGNHAPSLFELREQQASGPVLETHPPTLPHEVVSPGPDNVENVPVGQVPPACPLAPTAPQQAPPSPPVEAHVHDDGHLRGTIYGPKRPEKWYG